MSDLESDPDKAPKLRQRAVSSLTQQQRQHKRDLDRKAQRALRQRTRSRIQDLEADLVRLKQSSTEREVTAAAELQALRDENRSLRDKLENIGNLALGRARVLDGNSSGYQSSGSEAELVDADCITGNLPNPSIQLSATEPL